MADNFSGIRYFRANANNRSIAQQNSGNPSGLTDEILTPSVATGTITASTGSATVTGAGGVNFQTDTDSRDGSLMFAPGKDLYAYVGAGNVPTLVGRIQSVGSSTSLTLTANALTNASGLSSGTSLKLITTDDSIIVAIPTIVSGANRIIPNIASLRQSPVLVTTSFNNQSYIVLNQYSNAGSPVSISGSPLNIPTVVLAQNRFTRGNGDTLVWANDSALPATIYVLLDPFGVGSADNLAPKTKYRLQFEELLESITVSANTPVATLNAAGYNVTLPSSQTTTPPTA